MTTSEYKQECWKAKLSNVLTTSDFLKLLTREDSINETIFVIGISTPNLDAATWRCFTK